jgi:hypothetical protein
MSRCPDCAPLARRLRGHPAGVAGGASGDLARLIAPGILIPRVDMLGRVPSRGLISPPSTSPPSFAAPRGAIRRRLPPNITAADSPAERKVSTDDPLRQPKSAPAGRSRYVPRDVNLGRVMSPVLGTCPVDAERVRRGCVSRYQRASRTVAAVLRQLHRIPRRLFFSFLTPAPRPCVLAPELVSPDDPPRRRSRCRPMDPKS